MCVACAQILARAFRWALARLLASLVRCQWQWENWILCQCGIQSISFQKFRTERNEHSHCESDCDDNEVSILVKNSMLFQQSVNITQIRQKVSIFLIPFHVVTINCAWIIFTHFLPNFILYSIFFGPVLITKYLLMRLFFRTSMSLIRAKILIPVNRINNILPFWFFFHSEEHFSMV